VLRNIAMVDPWIPDPDISIPEIRKRSAHKSVVVLVYVTEHRAIRYKFRTKILAFAVWTEFPVPVYGPMGINQNENGVRISPDEALLVGEVPRQNPAGGFADDNQPLAQRLSFDSIDCAIDIPRKRHGFALQPEKSRRRNGLPDEVLDHWVYVV
jgi:hypothetical protein